MFKYTLIYILININIFCLFRATPKAYKEVPQARDHFGTVTTGLHHSSQQRQILNPLSEARDRTHILMDISQICFR